MTTPDLPADTLTTLVAAILAELPMDNTGHVTDCGFDDTANNPRCGCIDLRPRLSAAVVSVLATHNEQAVAEAKRAAVRSMAYLFRDMAPDLLPRRRVIDLLDRRADSYRLAAVSPTPPTHKEQQA